MTSVLGIHVASVADTPRNLTEAIDVYHNVNKQIHPKRKRVWSGDHDVLSCRRWNRFDINTDGCMNGSEWQMLPNFSRASKDTKKRIVGCPSFYHRTPHPT